jgi:hypothetical protein
MSDENQRSSSINQPTPQRLASIKEAAGSDARVVVDHKETGETKIYITYKPPVVQPGR